MIDGYIEERIDRLDIIDLLAALKNFTSTGLYSRIEEVICGAEIQVEITGGHVIRHTIPSLVKTEDTVGIVSWDDQIKSRDDLMQSYETRLCSIWSFYSLGRYPVFYNLYPLIQLIHL